MPSKSSGYTTTSIYWGEDPDTVDLLKRLQEISKTYPKLSLSSLLITSALACIDDLEKALLQDNLRRFQLNKIMVVL